MKHFMNPTIKQRTSNLFKQGKTSSDIRSSTVLYDDQEQIPGAEEQDDYDIALVDMQHPEHSAVVSGERIVE